MNILLDTCALIWILTEPEKLTFRAMDAFTHPANRIFVSVISAWEIAVKVAAGDLSVIRSPEIFLPFACRAQRIKWLRLDSRAALHVVSLPAIHKDPFDRMLICQAQTHGMPILTPDDDIKKYEVKTIW